MQQSEIKVYKLNCNDIGGFDFKNENLDYALLHQGYTFWVIIWPRDLGTFKFIWVNEEL